MRKLLLCLSVLGLMMIAVCAAMAQSEIGLGGSATDSLTFTGDGTGGWTLNFTPDPLTGTATGERGWSSISGTYTITQNGVSITGTPAGSGLWNISQSGPLLFSIGSLLTGDLELINLGKFGGTGVFNYDLTANMTITGGTLESLVGSGAKVGITIDFDSPYNLATLASGETLGARISTGEIDETPEAASMVLVGSGLLLLGGLVRRRRTAR